MAGYIGSKAVLLSTTAATVTGAADIGGDLTVDTDTLYVDATNNQVGIGTSSPQANLEVSAASGSTDKQVLRASTVGGGAFRVHCSDTSVAAPTWSIQTGASEPLVFSPTGTEAMRIDSSGNLLVGKTSSDATTQGFEARSGGLGICNVSNGYPLQLRRYSSDGDIIDFRRDGTTVGSIGNNGSRPYICSTGHGLYFGATATLATNGSGAPIDNAYDFGVATYRWDDIYATNGTIQTSDRNEKQDIAELDEAEKRVAVAAKGLIRKYRWKDAVTEKGDDARIHVGIIAQDLQAAFAAEGLDAGRYAMFISSTWWEHEGQTYETAEEAPEGATERTRLGVRYPELLAFIIGAM